MKVKVTFPVYFNCSYLGRIDIEKSVSDFKETLLKHEDGLVDIAEATEKVFDRLHNKLTSYHQNDVAKMVMREMSIPIKEYDRTLIDVNAFIEYYWNLK